MALGAEIGDKLLIKNSKKYIFSRKVCQHVPRRLRGHCSSINDWMSSPLCLPNQSLLLHVFKNRIHVNTDLTHGIDQNPY